MQTEQLIELAQEAIEELKALDLLTLDVRGKTSFTDCMLIASGRSERHVKSIADNVSKRAKAAGVEPLGMEGQEQGEWVLVDLGDVIVHVMTPTTRDFYQIEKLWSVDEQDVSADDVRTYH